MCPPYLLNAGNWQNDGTKRRRDAFSETRKATYQGIKFQEAGNLCIVHIYGDSK